jgi:hypothetical protein
MRSHIANIHKRFDRLDSQSQQLRAAFRRVEERMVSLDQKLELAVPHPSTWAIESSAREPRG